MSGIEEMRAAFARWQESGQSLRAFSRREGISYSKLMYWQRKLRVEGPIPRKPADNGGKATEGWVPVHVVDDPPALSAREWFEIRVASGHALRVPPDCDEAELRRLVTVLSTC